MKQTVFIATSEKGGARKSHSGGMIYHALVEGGHDSLVLALDTNNNLIGLLRKKGSFDHFYHKVLHKSKISGFPRRTLRPRRIG